MNKISFFSVAADSFFAAVCGFLLFFTAVRYYSSDAALGLACGIGAFISFGLLAFLYLKRKRGKKLLIGKDEREKHKLCLHLATISQNAAAKTILPLYKGAFINADDCIETDECIYVPLFRIQPLSPDDIAKEIKNCGQKRKEILCNAVSFEGAKTAAAFGLKLIQADDIYKGLKELDALPKEYEFAEKSKTPFLKRFSGAFRRSAALKLFWCGLCLLTFSFFTFFPLYYIISGGVILVLSAVCLIFGKRDNG